MLKISKKNVLSKVLAIALSLVMTVSLGATSAFAQTVPTAVALSADDGVFSQTVALNSVSPANQVTFRVVPVDANFDTIGFANEDDAVAVTWDVVDGSVSDVEIVTEVAEPSESGPMGTFANVTTFTVGNTSEAGAISLLATSVQDSTNPALNLTANFTIIVNGPVVDNAGVTVAGITHEFFQIPDDGTSLVPINSDMPTTVNAGAFLNGKSYVSGIDGLASSNIVTAFVNGGTATSPFVTSITIATPPGSTTLTADLATNIGWEFRVYRDTNNDLIPDTLLPISAFLGIGDVELELNDLVVWVFADFAEHDANTVFPATVAELPN